MPDYVEWDGTVKDLWGEKKKQERMKESVAAINKELNRAVILIDNGASLEEVESVTGLGVEEFPILKLVYNTTYPTRDVRRKLGDII